MKYIQQDGIKLSGTIQNIFSEQRRLEISPVDNVLLGI